MTDPGADVTQPIPVVTRQRRPPAPPAPPARRRKRRHPAQTSRIAAVGLSATAMGVLVAAMGHQASAGATETVTAASPATPVTAAPVTTAPPPVVVVRTIHVPAPSRSTSGRETVPGTASSTGSASRSVATPVARPAPVVAAPARRTAPVATSRAS